MNETTAITLSPILVGLGQLLEAAISRQWFVLIVVPFFVTIGAVALKRYARKIQKTQSADKVIGFDLGVGACLTLIVSGFVLLGTTAGKVSDLARQHYIVGLFLMLIIFLIALCAGAWLMHKSGWDPANPDKTSGKTYYAINIGGIIMLIMAFVLTQATTS